jgi:hypothetical protein
VSPQDPQDPSARLVELPDSSTVPWEGLEDDEATGDLGRPVRPAPRGTASPAGTSPRRDRDRMAVARAPGIEAEIPLHLLYPLRAWELARPGEQARLDTMTDGEKWVEMVEGALARDLEADDYRTVEERQYDFATDWHCSFGQLLEISAERQRRAAIAGYQQQVAENLLAVAGDRLTDDDIRAIVGEWDGRPTRASDAGGDRDA